MASPPFDIAQTTPQDNDIVSTFPAAERTYRDVVESWLLIDHNTSGQHAFVTLPNAAAPASPGASLTRLYADTSGNPKMRTGAAGSEEMLIPPGVLFPYTGATAPDGWLFPAGQAISRTTFSRLNALYSALGYPYGSGDGSTTFNVPDLRGRTVFGLDNLGGSAASRITSASGFVGNGTQLGGAGGLEAVAITTAQLPASAPSGTVSVSYTPAGAIAFGSTANNTFTPAGSMSGQTVSARSGAAISFTGATVIATTSAPDTSMSVSAGTFTGTPDSATFTGTAASTGLGTIVASFSGNNLGSGQAHLTMPPGMTLSWILKW